MSFWVFVLFLSLASVLHHHHGAADAKTTSTKTLHLAEDQVLTIDKPTRLTATSYKGGGRIHLRSSDTVIDNLHLEPSLLLEPLNQSQGDHYGLLSDGAAAAKRQVTAGGGGAINSASLQLFSLNELLEHSSEQAEAAPAPSGNGGLLRNVVIRDVDFTRSDSANIVFASGTYANVVIERCVLPGGIAVDSEARFLSLTLRHNRFGAQAHLDLPSAACAPLDEDQTEPCQVWGNYFANEHRIGVSEAEARCLDPDCTRYGPIVDVNNDNRPYHSLAAAVAAVLQESSSVAAAAAAKRSDSGNSMAHLRLTANLWVDETAPLVTRPLRLSSECGAKLIVKTQVAMPALVSLGGALLLDNLNVELHQGSSLAVYRDASDASARRARTTLTASVPSSSRPRQWPAALAHIAATVAIDAAIKVSAVRLLTPPSMPARTMAQQYSQALIVTMDESAVDVRDVLFAYVKRALHVDAERCTVNMEHCAIVQSAIEGGEEGEEEEEEAMVLSDSTALTARYNIVERQKLLGVLGHQPNACNRMLPGRGGSALTPDQTVAVPRTTQCPGVHLQRSLDTPCSTSAPTAAPTTAAPTAAPTRQRPDIEALRAQLVSELAPDAQDFEDVDEQEEEQVDIEQQSTDGGVSQTSHTTMIIVAGVLVFILLLCGCLCCLCLLTRGQRATSNNNNGRAQKSPQSTVVQSFPPNGNANAASAQRMRASRSLLVQPGVADRDSDWKLSKLIASTSQQRSQTLLKRKPILNFD